MKTVLKGVLYVVYCAAAAIATMVGMMAAPKIYEDFLEPKLNKLSTKVSSKD